MCMDILHDRLELQCEAAKRTRITSTESDFSADVNLTSFNTSICNSSGYGSCESSPNATFTSLEETGEFEDFSTKGKCLNAEL